MARHDAGGARRLSTAPAPRVAAMVHPQIDRRALLVGLGAATLAGCATETPRTTPASEESSVSPDRITYGDDPSQWVEVREPEGESRGLVAIIHGGFWRAQYDASLGTPLAEDLTARGWTTVNLEYRRVGNGGGFPETFDDVHRGLGVMAGTTTGPVVTLGHSAGGHLAAWAASRGRSDWPGGLEVTHVVSQAGVLDLTTAAEQGLGGGAVQALMGAGPDDASYDLADPQRSIPLDVPLWAVHAPDDDTVPFEQSTAYVDAATAAGAEATLVEVTGGHFGVIDTTSDAWAAIVEVLDSISPPR